MSDAEEQINSTSACFQFIPSKNDREQFQHCSYPESSFYCIKNVQQSVFPPLTTSSARPGSADSLFTIIPPVLQETDKNRKVSSLLAICFLSFLRNHAIFFLKTNNIL